MSLDIESAQAQTGYRAIEMFEQGKFDLVIMDIKLPDMDGVEATSRIREFELTTRRVRVPIIALTAYGSREQCIRAGMDNFLLKPVDFALFDAVIGRHLK